MKNVEFRRALLSFALVLILSGGVTAAMEPNTSFQTSGPWEPALQFPIDIAMVYRTDKQLIDTWVANGYIPWVMFGASWLSKDAEVVKNHPEIVQMQSLKDPFQMIPGRVWVVPVRPWIDYIKSKVDDAVKAGALAILPEEPEFFAVSGFSKSFQDAWNDYYHEPWQAPTSSPAAQWKASRLKAHLFTEFYREVCDHTKSLNPKLKCIIPTHSNLNYADWRVVTPHHAYSALKSVDGFIAQVWTGTAKHPHWVSGAPFASVFDYAYLEFSAFDELVAGTKKEVWFLSDPVEDAEGADWEDLENWYQQTLTATLMFPRVNKYEVIPWPQRVFLYTDTYGGSPVPQDYATEILTIFSAQKQIPPSGEFLEPVNNDIGFLTSDTLMWQRGLGSDRFQGFVAPMLGLVRLGILPRVIPVERLMEPDYPPREIKVLVADFDAWKPDSPEIVQKIAAWVHGGGVLLFIGGEDDYNIIPDAWWTRAGFSSPSDALLQALSLEVTDKKIFENRSMGGEMLNLPGPTKPIISTDQAPDNLKKITHNFSPLPMTSYDVKGSSVLMTVEKKPIVWESVAGKGYLIYAGFPGEFMTQKKQGTEVFQALLKYALETRSGARILTPPALVLRRGNFIIARGLSAPYKLDGNFVNIFKPQDPIADGYVIQPGQNVFLLDVNKAVAECDSSSICILFSSGITAEVPVQVPDDVKIMPNPRFSFLIKGPKDRIGYAWIHFPDNLKSIASETPGALWHEPTATLRVQASMTPQGTEISINL